MVFCVLAIAAEIRFMAFLLLCEIFERSDIFLSWLNCLTIPTICKIPLNISGMISSVLRLERIGLIS